MFVSPVVGGWSYPSTTVGADRTGKQHADAGPARATPTSAASATAAVATVPSLALQRAAGNRAVTDLIQRKAAPTKPTKPSKPSKADAASAELLAMTLGWVLDGLAADAEIAPLTAVQKEFAIALSQAITGRAFGKKARLGPEQREAEWERAGML
jgi:hypothetical protein